MYTVCLLAHNVCVCVEKMEEWIEKMRVSEREDEKKDGLFMHVCVFGSM